MKVKARVLWGGIMALRRHKSLTVNSDQSYDVNDRMCRIRSQLYKSVARNSTNSLVVWKDRQDFQISV